MPEETVGKAVQIIEMDVDLFRATQFESLIPTEDDSRWTTRWGTTTIRGVSNPDLPSKRGGQYITPTQSGVYMISFDPVDNNLKNASVLAGFIPRSTANQIGVICRASGNPLSNNASGYELVISGGTTLTLRKRRLNSVSTVATATFNYGANDIVWLLLEAIDAVSVGGGSGVVLRGKAWLGRMSQQPIAFSVTGIDSSNPLTAAGYSGIVRVVS